VHVGPITWEVLPQLVLTHELPSGCSILHFNIKENISMLASWKQVVDLISK